MDNLRQEFNKLKVLIEKQFKREYDLIALADKRLVLLKRVNTVRMYADVPCPICLEKPKHRYIGDTVSLVDSHADDCELAEAIDGSAAVTDLSMFEEMT